MYTITVLNSNAGILKEQHANTLNVAMQRLKFLWLVRGAQVIRIDKGETTIYLDDADEGVIVNLLGVRPDEESRKTRIVAAIKASASKVVKFRAIGNRANKGKRQAVFNSDKNR